LIGFGQNQNLASTKTFNLLYGYAIMPARSINIWKFYLCDGSHKCARL